MSYSMSTRPNSLTAKHADLTQRVILDGALDLIQAGSWRDFSVRAVAQAAGISERTVFRYFPNREDLLVAVMEELRWRSHLPPVPQTTAELLAFPRVLFERFEETSTLTRAILDSELYQRIRTSPGDDRASAIRAIIDREAPDRSEHERRLVAANIGHRLVASTWRYYRDYFGFSLEDTIESARMAIEQALISLGIASPPASPARRPR